MDISELKKLKKEWKKLPFFDNQEFDKGVKLAANITKTWNSQPNPGKVFIKGRRVHHGTVGAFLAVAGILGRDSLALGYAYGLMEDDIDDAEEWVSFEKGGDPKSFFSME